LGGSQAITAIAHKLARIVYHILTIRQAYDESVFVKQAKTLGFELIPMAA
jgi:hypothetical protein